MKKFSGSIIAVAGALFFIPGLTVMVQNADSLSTLFFLLALFYLAAIILGLIGAWIAIKNPLTASKILAVATLSGIPVILITLFLSTSLDGLNFRYTVLGLFFMAIATAIIGKQEPVTATQ
jgi:hypothetical protein